jgi:hypothetical protein
MKTWREVVTVTAIVIGFSNAAFGQDAQLRAPRAAVDGVEVLTGLMDFDLQGTGQAMPVAIRASKALGGGFALEVGTTFARPDLQSGPSSLTIPEARVTYTWFTGRFRPFVGAGAGFGFQRTEAIDKNWRMTAATGGGARFHFSDRVYAIGEMTLRGLSDFAATTAEWMGGIGIRFDR